MSIKRSTAIHDLSESDALIKMDANIGDKKILTCEVSWKGVIGTGAKVILRGSNSGINFSNLGEEVVLTVGSDFATLIDRNFPHDIGAVFIEKNSATEGIVTLKFLAK